SAISGIESGSDDPRSRNRGNKMKRTASCSCGQLSISVSGSPNLVAACNCLQCQKRTGSAFGISSLWPKSAVEAISGNSSIYRGSSDAGRMVDLHFCPTCGNTVFWYAEVAPDFVGIAVGNFADPSFAPPDRAVWCDSKHAWIVFPERVKQFQRSSLPGSAP